MCGLCEKKDLQLFIEQNIYIVLSDLAVSLGIGFA